MPTEDDPQYAITEAIGIASHLLTVAAEKGKEVERDVALPITTAIEAARHENLNPNIEADFWTAFTKLSKIIEPVSVVSFSPKFIEDTTRYKRNYIIFTAALLVLLMPLSIAGFIVNAINADIAATAEATCNTVKELNCAKPPLADQPNPSAIPTNDRSYAEKSARSMNFAGYKIWRDSTLLNDFTLLNPWTDEDLKGGFKCNCDVLDTNDKFTSGIPISAQARRECVKGYRTCDKQTEWQDESVRNPAQTFEGQIWFARYLKHSSDVTYGVIGANILPILYAMLGACAFGFRNLLGPVTRPLTSTAAMGPLVRLPLAALAGFVIGIFTDPTKGLPLSALAIAFAVGYAAEVFYTIIDAGIAKIKAMRGSPASRSSDNQVTKTA